MGDFTFFNINPNRIEEEDCVCRAISAGTGLPYSVVDNMLELVASKCECDKLNVECYKHLLSDVFMYKCLYCNRGETVEEIAYKYRHNILIIRIKGHLTASMYGAIVDLWDCTQEEVDRFWVVQR